MLHTANNAETKLAEDVGKDDETITVDDASVLPDTPFLVTIGDKEIVKVTKVDGDELTVERGQEDTDANSHDKGAQVENRWTAGMYESLKLKVDGHTIFINDDGELTLTDPDGDDPSKAPGPDNLVAGNMNAGYFGEVSSNDFIFGDELASKLELDEGGSENLGVGWLKFAYKNKIQFISKKTIRTSSWEVLDDAGLVDGDKSVEIDGLKYKVRLMSGADENPASDDEGKAMRNSEWNKLMLPIHENAPDNWEEEGNVGSETQDWGIGFTDKELGTNSDTYTICQEQVKDSGKYIVRGTTNVEGSTSYSKSIFGQNGFRPVLVLE